MSLELIIGWSLPGSFSMDSTWRVWIPSSIIHSSSSEIQKSLIQVFRKKLVKFQKKHVILIVSTRKLFINLIDLTSLWYWIFQYMNMVYLSIYLDLVSIVLSFFSISVEQRFFKVYSYMLCIFYVFVKSILFYCIFCLFLVHRNKIDFYTWILYSVDSYTLRCSM